MNSGWSFLAGEDVSQGGCQYKHAVRALPWAPPAAPPLRNNFAGVGFASCCCAGCQSRAGAAIVRALLPKIRIPVASKTCLWLGALSAVYSCLHLLGGEDGCNATEQILGSSGNQVTRYKLLLKAYLFGMTWVQLRLALKKCLWVCGCFVGF